MRGYLVAFITAGIVLPMLLHFLSPGTTPWWPDTVSMGPAFGLAAVVLVWRSRKDRATRQRFVNALRDLRR